MTPAKPTIKENAIEKDASENGTAQSAQGSETDNEDKPLQIDTENETKAQDKGNKNKEKRDEKHQAGSKRSGDENSIGTPIKKARSKSKPVQIENMKEYVDSNTIEKLTRSTLSHWLKEKKQHCSTRDKKADLIQKIKNHFVSTSS